MRALLLALLAALAFSPASGSGARKQFNLICKGHERRNELNTQTGWHDGGSIQIVFHIDLSTGAFCYDSCEHAYKLTHWDAHRIDYEYFAYTQSPRDDDNLDQTVTESIILPDSVTQSDSFTIKLHGMTFRRDTHELECAQCRASRPILAHVSGTCRMAPFSGIARKQ